jgi:predicted metal-dependent TIM-barrel fold hydrolase
MPYVEPHIHMISRTTDDYVRLARAGCEVVSEPAFWAGFDRGSAAAFVSYFRHISQFEPRRAAQYGLRHFCWLGVNAKEAEDVALSREVISIIPPLLDGPNVLGFGEIGLNKNTRNEATVLMEQFALAGELGELVLVHTPHLADKYKGTRMTLDMLRELGRIPPNRVVMDHAEEHTVRLSLDEGYWVGLTLYPMTKCTPARAADIVEVCGPDRLMINSAADWGPSNPMAVPECIAEMNARGFSPEVIKKVTYDNPLAFFRQSKRWKE